MKSCISGTVEVVNKSLTGIVVVNESLMGFVKSNHIFGGVVVSAKGICGKATAEKGIQGECSLVCSLNRTPFLKVNPGVVWLTNEELSSAQFEVVGNVKWIIE